MAKNGRYFSRRELFGLLASFPSASCKQSFIKPKYQIGQWVKQTHIIDDSLHSRDGKQAYSIGCIVGLVYEHPDWKVEKLKTGWTYYVKWYIDHGERCNPFVEFAHSSELEIYFNYPWADFNLMWLEALYYPF